jgi:uncharacterized repeat protein (TIGR04042 family)
VPEMQFVVRWPDETVMACYSPSLVILEYLEVGESYTVSEFVERSRTALEIASERVREKFGYPCVNAHAQLQQILTTARKFEALDGARVTVEGFDSP